MAKTSGERAPGTSLGISITNNGAQYLSHGAMIDLCSDIMLDIV